MPSYPCVQPSAAVCVNPLSPCPLASRPGMADVILDVTAKSMSLKAPGFSDTVEAFPVTVRFEETVAKFNKKTHVLTVTVPTAM